MGSLAGITPAHAARLRRILTNLHTLSILSIITEGML